MVAEPQVQWIATINKYIEKVLLQSIFAMHISLALFSLLYAGGQKLWQALSFLLLPEGVLRFWVVNPFSWKSHYGATEKLFSKPGFYEGIQHHLIAKTIDDAIHTMANFTRQM